MTHPPQTPAPDSIGKIVAELRKEAQVERDRSWEGAPHGADEWKLDDWAERLLALPSHAELERDAAEREKSNRWAASLAATNIVMVGEIVEHLRDFHLGFLDGHELATALQMMLDRQDARAKEAKR